mmetsp:Transcript_31503/g.53206  ORF Transcript_31503/g.53206 Transcript_31503/m.53206 type:complete len:443 (+) Transcript_31503:99-1427(+)
MDSGGYDGRKAFTVGHKDIVAELDKAYSEVDRLNQDLKTAAEMGLQLRKENVHWAEEHEKMKSHIRSLEHQYDEELARLRQDVNEAEGRRCEAEAIADDIRSNALVEKTALRERIEKAHELLRQAEGANALLRENIARLSDEALHARQKASAAMAVPVHTASISTQTAAVRPATAVAYVAKPKSSEPVVGVGKRPSAVEEGEEDDVATGVSIRVARSNVETPNLRVMKDQVAAMSSEVHSAKQEVVRLRSENSKLKNEALKSIRDAEANSLLRGEVQRLKALMETREQEMVRLRTLARRTSASPASSVIDVSTLDLDPNRPPLSPTLRPVLSPHPPPPPPVSPHTGGQRGASADQMGPRWQATSFALGYTYARCCSLAAARSCTRSSSSPTTTTPPPPPPPHCCWWYGVVPRAVFDAHRRCSCRPGPLQCCAGPPSCPALLN